MAAHKALDHQPGSPPDIRREGDDITFVLEVAGAPEQVKLVIRCTPLETFVSVMNLPEPRR